MVTAPQNNYADGYLSLKREDCRQTCYSPLYNNCKLIVKIAIMTMKITVKVSNGNVHNIIIHVS